MAFNGHVTKKQPLSSSFGLLNVRCDTFYALERGQTGKS
jgi:hypothetical protein